MTSSKLNVQSALPRTPHSALRTLAGFTYVALLAAIVIIGIALGSAGKYWQNVMLREKEEELLFRGGQYRSAIEKYYFAKTPNAYPPSIEDLLTDNRTAKGRRHLRQQFKDPITGEDFEIIRDKTKGNRITGVYSKSEAEPLRQSEFPEEDKDFEGKKTYKEWQFLFNPQQQLGGLGVSGGKGGPGGSGGSGGMGGTGGSGGTGASGGMGGSGGPFWRR